MYFNRLCLSKSNHLPQTILSVLHQRVGQQRVEELTSSEDQDHTSWAYYHDTLCAPERVENIKNEWSIITMCVYILCSCTKGSESLVIV